MNLFDKRPLCLILCIMLGGFIFFTDAQKTLKVFLLALTIVYLVVSIYLKIIKYTKTKLFIVSAAVLLISYLFSFLYFDLYFNVYEKYDENVEIIGVVSDVEDEDNGYSVIIECNEINGSSYSKKLSVFIPFDTLNEVKENDVLSINGELTDFSNKTDFDTRSYQRAQGVSARITNITNIKCIDVADEDLEGILKNYRHSIGDFIIGRSDEDGGGLLTALLLGERQYLSSSTRLAYKRTGLSHTLALSGMHLAILSVALTRILSFFGINKKPRKIIEIVFVLAYMALTGMPTSVVRAGIMLILSSLLFLMAVKADQITTLSIAVTLICVISPESIYDVSLWLSAFATLGILVYIELEERNNKNKRIRSKLIKDILLSVVISCFAIGATILISFLAFGTISVLGPLTSPVFCLLIELFIYIGLVFITFGHFIGMGDIISYVGSGINGMIKSISSLDGIYLSADSILVETLIIVFFALILMFLIFKIKARRVFVSILGVLLITIYGTSYLNYVSISTQTRFDYAASGDNEYFFLSDENEMTLVTLADYTVNDAYDTVSFIESYELYDVDNLIITSYSESVYDYINVINESIYIENLYLPLPKSNKESEVYSKLCKTSDNASYNLIGYNAGQILDFDLHSVVLTSRFDQIGLDRCSLLFLKEDNTVAYLSSGMYKSETKNVATDMINGADSVIFGRHGDRYYDYVFNLKIESFERIILNSENFELSVDVLRFYRHTEIIKDSDYCSFIR